MSKVETWLKVKTEWINKNYKKNILYFGNEMKPAQARNNRQEYWYIKSSEMKT